MIIVDDLHFISPYQIQYNRKYGCMIEVFGAYLKCMLMLMLFVGDKKLLLYVDK